MDSSEKVIWITGASSGIGKAMALQYAQLGARLILSSRDRDALEKVRSSTKNPGNIHILEVDLEHLPDCDDLVQKAVDYFGSLDILINNAGISQRSLASETLLEVDRRIFEINYFGTIALTKSLIPYFVKNGGGQFVVVTSVVGKIGTPLRSSYAASKHALHGFFDSLRAELYKDHVDITLICPGFVDTKVSENALTGKGQPQRVKDQATAKGLDAAYFAKKAIRAIHHKKQEVVIGGFLEVLAVYVKRCFPLLLSKMIRKAKVT